jgi:hypothetical protein
MRGIDALAVAGMLGMGTIKTLLSKLMYGIQARGIDGSVHSFEVRRKKAQPRRRNRAAARPRRKSSCSAAPAL